MYLVNRAKENEQRLAKQGKILEARGQPIEGTSIRTYAAWTICKTRAGH